MNTTDLFNPEEDFREASEYYTLLDASHLIDDMGVLPFLRETVRTMNNPTEQHVLTQLLLIAEKYEHVMLKMKRADEVLYEVYRD